MIRRVKTDAHRAWCGPTATASMFGMTYEEADLLLRKVRGQKRRVVQTSSNNHRTVARLMARRRKVFRDPLLVTLKNNDMTELTTSQRPRLNSRRDLNYIMRLYPTYIPIGIFVSRQGDIPRHIIAYDHKRKRLCDNWSHGKVVKLDDHPCKRWYVFTILMMPKEYYA